MLAAASRVRSEERYRAQAALRALDAAREPELALAAASPEWALSVGRAAVEIVLYVAHGEDRSERERAARLMAAFCREAGRLRVRREAEAALA